MNTLFLLTWKSLMNVDHEHHDTYKETFLHMLHRISSSHNCHTEKSAVWVHRLPFITVIISKFLSGRPCDCYVIANDIMFSLMTLCFRNCWASWPRPLTKNLCMVIWMLRILHFSILLMSQETLILILYMNSTYVTLFLLEDGTNELGFP